MANRGVERDAGDCVWYFVKGRAYGRWDHEGNDSIPPNGWEIVQFCPSAGLLVLGTAHTAKSDIRVHVY